MADTIIPLVLLSLFLSDAVFGCQTPPWVLKRADPGSSSVSFFNNTVSDEYMVVRWTWRDSSGGFWDTRLRVSMNKEEMIVGGGFTYSDRYENELASTRWYRTRTHGGPIRWKYNSFASPPDSWWMTSVVPRGNNVTWGFKNQITDGSWVFIVGNDTLEAKNIQNVDGWAQGMGNGHRWRRSLKDQKMNDVGLQMRRQQDLAKDIDEDFEIAGGDGNVMQAIMNYIMEFFQMPGNIKDMLTSFG